MYKLVIQYHNSKTITEGPFSFGKGLARLKELCLLVNVKDVPFLTLITKTDNDMKLREYT